MCRALTKIPWRSIADSYSKLKAHQHGWRSCSADKLVFGRTLTTSQAESTTKSMQMQIVHSLRMGDRSKASSLLSILAHGNYSLRADDFVDILTYCARSPDPLFVLETWSTMDKKKISVDDICSLLMLRALCKGGYLEEAFNFINFGESHGISQISPIYNTFLGACAKMQNSTHANKCLDLMEHRLVGKNEVTYIQLLKLAVWQKNLSAVHEIWNDYIKHYSLSIISLRKFIWSYTRLGDLKSAYGILQQMVALAIRGTTSIYRNVEGKLLSSKLDIPIPLNRELGMKKLDPEAGPVSIPSMYCEKLDSNAIKKEECAAFVFGIREAERMQNMYNSKPLMKVLRWSFSDVIHGCARLKNRELAEQLILQMQNLGLQPSSHTYDGFVRAVISERGFSFGMEVLKIMQQRDFKPYDPTLATLSVSCSKELELDLAEDMLDQITECSHPHPFNALLAACDTLDQPASAVQILAKMKQLKVRPDIRTYELLFSIFGNVNAPYEKGNILSKVDTSRRIKAIEMDMATNRVQHSHLSMKNLLRALGAEGMTTELIQYLQVAENLFSCNDTYVGTPIYNTVLHSLVEAKESHKAIMIFKDMKSCGVLPDDVTYNIMIDCCSILRCFRSASALASMMLRCGCMPQNYTYTALIKILLEDENFDEALNLLNQAISEGIQLDVLLFNTILQKACDKGMIDVIEFVVEQMHQEKIRPDTSTCNHVFSAYVYCGFHNTAMEALQVLTMRMVCEEDGSLPEKTEFGDDFILSEGLEVESRILQLFKDCEEDLAVALLNLRLSAIVGSSISWSPNESPWAKRLSTKYGTR